MLKNIEGRQNIPVMDVLEPQLYRDVFPYEEIPKIRFNNAFVPYNLPETIWITDTTFRDGQQSMASFSVDQIVRLFKLIHKLDNGEGVIRQSEFFLYSEKDREAVRKCQELGYEFPEITSWIRADERDFKLVKEMNIAETGMLMSCSDYHIFKKLKMTRSEAMQHYLTLAMKAMEAGIKPRCHLEDITRADFYGFVVPFVKNLKRLSQETGISVKIRACDTLGVGVPYNGTELPRSVPKMISELRNHCGLKPEEMEWHGHNDYHNVVTASTASWLYGGASVNAALLGIGERTGNCPLEAMLFEYAQLKGSLGKVNLPVLNEIVRFFKEELSYTVDPKRPFVGSEFNMTKAGIHADGLLKDESIYNSFDTNKLLNRPVVVKVNQSSGAAGIAAWINTYYHLDTLEKVDKHDPRIATVKRWVDNTYEAGRTEAVSNAEMEQQVKKAFTTGIHQFSLVK